MKTKFLLFFSLALLALTKMSAQDSFTQISLLEELTTGEYLIVGDGSTNDGIMRNAQNGSGNNTYILHDEISAPGTTISEGFTANNVFTITVDEDQLTIYNASVGYVTYRGTGNHASFYNDTPTNSEKWTFSVEGGLWSLNNVNTTNRVLQWNNGSPRFAAYTNAQVKLKLYKKDEVEPSVYTIDVTQPTGGSISPEGSIEVEEGENAEFTATANSCFQFVNWVVDGENAGNTNPYVFSNVTEDHTITAVFEEITYVVVASAGANGTITPNGEVEVNCGADQTFTITADAGFEIADVLVDGESVGAVATYTFTEVDANHTISATFSLIEEPSDFCVSEDFENIPTEQGTSYQTRTWTGNDGIEWTANDARTDQTITGKAIALRASTLTNTTPISGGVGTISFDYKRIFANNSTLKVFVNGTQYGGDITVSSETPVTFTTEVNVAGNITVEIVNAGNRIAIDNLAWTCTDVEPCFNTITSTAGANGIITPAGEIEVNCGADQTFTITADAGYEIVDVLVDGESVGAVATYTFTEVDANHTISATFSLIEEPSDFCVSEDFENIPTEQGTSYQTRTWTGNDGIEWTANDARTDQTITGKAIALRASTLTNTTPISGGVGTISFDYKRIFANNSTLKVFVNGTQYGGDITVSSETPATFTTEVNVAGNITVEIVNAGNRIAIDNLAWTCTDVEPCFNTITSTAGANGTITPNGEVEVNCGADQTFTITADAGFEIADVLVDGVSVGAVATYTFTEVDADHTISATFSLIEEPSDFCVSEDFENIPTEQGTSYQTRTWTGNDGIEWTANDARTDQTITGKAIALRASTLTNTTPISGGVGTISFDYKRIFANNSTLKVFVNGTQYGGDITVSSETPATFTTEVNVAGNITVEIVNAGNRIAIDNLAWTCTDVEPCFNTITSTAGANGTITPTGEVEVNCGADQTFTITADAGYEIADVLVDGVSVGSVATYTFTEVDADHTISVTFEEVVTEEPCFEEEFTNLTEIPTGTNYGEGTYTNNGITWSFHGQSPLEAGGDASDYSIEGQGILLRRASDSYLEATIPAGVSIFSFEYRKAYTGGNERQLELLVNGTQVATTPIFGAGSGDDPTVYTFSHTLNTTASTVIRIKLTGETTTNRHATIDNISWTCDGEPCTTPAPVAIGNFEFVAGDTLADLEDSLEYTGELTWYQDEALTIILPNTTLVEDTVYYVTQTIDGCESDALEVETEELGIDSHAFENFSYYPNPVKNILTLKNGSKVTKVEVYTLSGVKVWTKNLNVNQAELNFSGLESGAYILKVSTEKGSKTVKILKK